MARNRGLPQTWHLTEPISAQSGGDTVCSVIVRNRGTGTEVHARSMQGATEPGGLLPVAGWEEQYIREARCIRAVVTVTQAHAGATARGVMRGEPASGTSQWRSLRR